jgi:acyl-ACP thioesterase
VERLVPQPTSARTFSESRRIRLSEMDGEGRLRLDSVARYLQDVAIDDVDETGWGAPEHLWFLRSMRMEVLAPPLEDTEVEVTTWCSGSAAVAAGRRMSLVGDRGGRVELDSVWIHLGPDARPARIEGFGLYAEAAGDRTVSTRLELPAPPSDARRRPWETRASDIDLFGHVNNAVYWQGVEGRLREGGIDPHAPLRARLEYRHAIDLGEDVELAEFPADGGWGIAFVSPDAVKAVALVESLR